MDDAVQVATQIEDNLNTKTFVRPPMPPTRSKVTFAEFNGSRTVVKSSTSCAVVTWPNRASGSSQVNNNPVCVLQLSWFWAYVL